MVDFRKHLNKEKTKDKAMKTKFGQRVGRIFVSFVNKTTRTGYIVMGGLDYLDGTEVEDYAGAGFTFVCQTRESSRGGVFFSGPVSSPRLNDEDDYPDTEFDIILNPYSGANEKIAYTFNISNRDPDGGYGEKIMGGILYKGNVAGTCGGYISLLEPDDEDEAPPKRAATRTKGKATAKKETAKKSRKPEPEDDDDIPF